MLKVGETDQGSIMIESDLWYLTVGGDLVFGVVPAYPRPRSILLSKK